MKQLNFELVSISDLDAAIVSINDAIKNISYKSLVFHLYTIKFEEDEIRTVLRQLSESFYGCIIAGTSTNGDICDGHLAEYGMVISVSIFESTWVKSKIFNCPAGQETETGKLIADTIDASDDIIAAEILITLKSINSHKVLDAVEACHKDILVFGGGSAAYNIADTRTCVIDSKDISGNGVLLVTYCGKDLHVNIEHAIGWKPLGKDLIATRIEGKRLYEINDMPAGKVYSKYLDIHADEDFFANILEFPIMSHQHGYNVLRLPFSINSEDNSIELAADIDKGTPIHLSYGDPEVIRSDVNNLVQSVKKFAPQAIFLYSCGVRRLYWKYLINKETAPFAHIAPTAGFYSSGEIMRMGNYIIEHHVTLIAISMREGPKAQAQPTDAKYQALPMSEEEKMHSQVSMVRRLANFINVTSKELQEANDKLQEMADTDELTGLYNRRMLDRLVTDAIGRANMYNIDMILGIIDIDDFKNINDTYGHAAGDLVLKTLSATMNNEIIKLPSGIIGRWGGEEFLFLAPNLNVSDVIDNIEKARQRVSSIKFEDIGNVTISLGITSFKLGDTAESIFKRADDALYEAKQTGKNKTCVK